jgi:hypothetical protein
MLIAHTRAWTRTQKALIVASVLAALTVFAAGVYTYERYHRGPTDAVFFGTWEMEGMCMDCALYLSLQPDHNVVGFGEAVPDLRWPVGRGRWYAGGELLVIHLVTEGADAVPPLIMRIVDIAPDVIRLRRDGEEIRMLRSTHGSPQASNQAMQLTASKRVDCAFSVCRRGSMLRFMHRGLAAADLVSR